MYPILFDNSKTVSAIVADTGFGLGELVNASDVHCTRESNGIYELSFEYPVDGPLFSDIKVNNYVKAVPEQGKNVQLFRIQQVNTPLLGTVQVFAVHISYDLLKAIVLPCSATGAVAACKAITDNIVGTYPFTITTDITNTTSEFSVKVPQPVRSIMGGVEGSLLDVFGGEWEFDNLTCTLKASAGHDYGVTIEYGKNLITMEQDANIEAMYDAAIGYYAMDDTVVYSDIQYIGSAVTAPKTMAIDFTSEFDFDTVPTKAQLNTRTKKYITDNKLNEPKINLDIDFVNLADTINYKGSMEMETINLYDTVTVDVPARDVAVKAKVIRTVWDVVLERYYSISIGSPRSSFAQAIAEATQSITKVEATSWYEQALQRATEALIGGLGGYKVELFGEDGTPYGTRYMDTPTLTSTTKGIEINKNGMFYSTDGFRTVSDAAIYVDSSGGHIVADFIDAGTLKAIDIEGVTIKGSSISGTNITGGTIQGSTIKFGGDGTYGTLAGTTYTQDSKTFKSGMFTGDALIALVEGKVRLGAGSGASTGSSAPTAFVDVDSQLKAVRLHGVNNIMLGDTNWNDTLISANAKTSLTLDSKGSARMGYADSDGNIKYSVMIYRNGCKISVGTNQLEIRPDGIGLWINNQGFSNLKWQVINGYQCLVGTN